jgi:hypothetical protein
MGWQGKPWTTVFLTPRLREAHGGAIDGAGALSARAVRRAARSARRTHSSRVHMLGTTRRHEFGGP